MAAVTAESIEIRVTRAGDNASLSLREFASSLKEVSGTSKSATKSVSSLVSSFQRITYYRVIRSIIKTISKAFQEGAQNAYFFSKTIGGDLAQSLDMLATKSFTMTNQMGASWATLLQTIQPILLQIIEFVRRAAEAITQFFAVLGGKSTYLKAVDASKDWATNTAAGAKAAKEWKNQLMGFDEINRLEDTSGSGGGSGSGLPNFGQMFEETPIESWLYRFIDRISSVIDDVKLIFKGLEDFIFGVFTGDWDRAFRGLGNIVEGFGKLVEDTISLSVDVLDGFNGQIIKIVDELFKWIEDKTGLNLSSLRETIIYQLNYIRYFVDGVCIKIGWVVEDLALMISSILKGDWEGAWEAAKKAVQDASINIDDLVAEMAKTVTDEMMGVSSKVSQHSRTSHSSVAVAAEGIGDSIAGAGNASADFAEMFKTNMDAVRDQITTLGESSLTVQSSGDTLSFVARVANAVSKIARFARFVTNPGLGFHAAGGFPDEGELFVAREAGPELVGSIGNRTAVANNDQIVQGIRAGVYEAVVSAMSLTGGGSDTPINIYMDGKQIAKSTTKYQNQFARAGTM